MRDTHRGATAADVEVRGPLEPGYDRILTPRALAFLAELAVRFAPRVRERLDARERDGADRLDFPAETAHVRESDWTIAPLPRDLACRLVEITGPVDRKMIINALNSGADCFMADFEDSSAPTWSNMVEGQQNLHDAVRGTIEYHDAVRDKHYRLGPSPATLMVRPRGWHLVERHVLVDGRPIPAALFDFGLFVFHDAHALLEHGSAPYFYLPKLEHYLEARLWNDVFVFAQKWLGIPVGTFKATVLIETLPAAFCMDEILYELRDHSAGLNCGRWDYIFSYIKTRAGEPDAVLPDRSQVSMTQPCMRAYTQLVVKTCHRRGAPAIGGMAAQIPIKDDPEANARAIAKVEADKRREAEDGHDGTWVAHPGLVDVARRIFREVVTGDNQLHVRRGDVQVTRDDLLRVPIGTTTEDGLRLNVRVGIQYLAAWLGGNGCVPLYHLMEDAATAEISRAQIWQWCRHGITLACGRTVTPELIDDIVHDETVALADRLGRDGWRDGRFEVAKALFREIATARDLAPFLTLAAYDQLGTGG